MKIGLDAKWYFTGPPSGHNVVKNIVDDIINRYSDLEIYIILKKEDKGKLFRNIKDNVHLIYTGITSNNLLWNILISPIQLRKLNLDVVLFQNFSPFISNFKRIAFIYDVIFKSS